MATRWTLGRASAVTGAVNRVGGLTATREDGSARVRDHRIWIADRGPTWGQDYERRLAWGFERSRAAVNLILHDVEHEVGPNVVRIEFDDAGKRGAGRRHATVVAAKTSINLGRDITGAWE